MIKSNLVTIAYEVEDAYSNYYMKWNEFLEEVSDILTYYKSTIYKSSKIIINKKIGNAGKFELDDTDNEFLNSINFDEFICKLKLGIDNCCEKYDKETLYDQIISIIIGECIVFYKQCQIITCRNLNIKHFKLIGDSNCCDSCKTLSKFTLNVDNFNVDNIHPYCKQFILPFDASKTTNINVGIADFENTPQILLPIIKNLTTKLKIQLKSFISYKKFIFGEYDKLLINDDKILIPSDLVNIIDIEELIVGELIKDNLFKSIDINNWMENYKIKKDSGVHGDKCIIYSLPFVNNISDNSCEEYILQSAITYIMNGNDLKNLDISAYNKLKDLFKKEFVRG